MGCLIHTGKKRNVYTILAGKPEGKSLFGRPGCVCESKRYKVKFILLQANEGSEGE